MRSAFTLEKNRGRVERRTLSASTQDVAWADWPGLGQFLRLERSVTVHGETTTTVQYAITSLSPDRASPERFLDLWRGRWRSRTACSGCKRCRVRRRCQPHPQRHRSAVDEPDQECRDEHPPQALKVPNITAALRENALKVPNLFHKLGITTK
ncbi:MAG: hypothetical protein R3B91_14910 [Planctomycetaceae bacterium]